MKTGIIEAEPSGFYQALANVFDAALITPDAIRLELNGGEFSRRKSLTRAVTHEARERTCVALLAGSSVVYNGFLNTRRGRETMRTEVAQLAGAAAVLLSVRASRSLINFRIRERHAQGKLNIPSEHIPDITRTLAIAHSMARTTEWPAQDEPALQLDGSLPVLALLEEVVAYTQQLPEAV